MTDITPLSGAWASTHAAANLKKRHRAELMLKGFGLAAISVAFLMLFILISSLVTTGWQAFTQTHVTIDFSVTADRVKPDKIESGNYRALMQDAMIAALPSFTEIKPKDLADILSNAAQFDLRDLVVADPALIGKTVTMRVPVSDSYDLLNKGLINRDTPLATKAVAIRLSTSA